MVKGGNVGPMAQINANPNLITRLADRGEQVVGRITELPGAKQLDQAPQLLVLARHAQAQGARDDLEANRRRPGLLAVDLDGQLLR